MPDLHLFLASGSYSPNALSLATGVASFVIILLGAGVLVRGRGLAASRLFFLLTVCTAGWLAAFSWMYASSSDAPWPRSGRTAGPRPWRSRRAAR